MKQPGVTVQPLRQMNGYASFNQVFFTDANVEPEFLVSDVGDGWAVTTTTLMHERRGADGLRAGRSPPTSWAASMRRSGRKSARRWSPTSGIRNVRGASNLILERARATGKINDPVLRQEIAKVLAMSKGPPAAPARRRNRGDRRASRAPSASWRPASSRGRPLAFASALPGSAWRDTRWPPPRHPRHPMRPRRNRRRTGQFHLQQPEMRVIVPGEAACARIVATARVRMPTLAMPIAPMRLNSSSTTGTRPTGRSRPYQRDGRCRTPPIRPV